MCRIDAAQVYAMESKRQVVLAFCRQKSATNLVSYTRVICWLCLVLEARSSRLSYVYGSLPIRCLCLNSSHSFALSNWLVILDSVICHHNTSMSVPHVTELSCASQPLLASLCFFFLYPSSTIIKEQKSHVALNQ